MTGEKLRDRIVVVTGAGAGIGAAIASLAAEHGASVAVLDINEQAAQATVAGIQANHAGKLAVRCNVTRSDDVQRALDSVVNAFGGIDVLVNNAGISHDGSILDTPEEDWDRVLSVNLKGVFLCSKYGVPRIIDRGGGAVVNIASVAGLAGLRRGAAYNASKAGVVMLTRNMALDLAPHGIRVNCVCPGATLTPMYEAGIARGGDPETVRQKMTALRPLGRLGQPRETAEVVVFLASSEASYMTGAVLVVDGGVMA